MPLQLNTALEPPETLRRFDPLAQIRNADLEGGRGSASLHRRFKNSLIQKTWCSDKYVLTLMRMRDIIIVSVIYGLSWIIHTKRRLYDTVRNERWG